MEKKTIADEVVNIHPRYVNVSESSRPGKFAIKNTSEGKNIYFKIKRCEDTISVDYNPKYGCVEAGGSVEVSLQLVEGEKGSNSSKIRLYVKMAVLDRSEVGSSFKQNWQKGSEGVEVLKKLVEVNTSKSNVSSPVANGSTNRARQVVSPSLSVGNEDNLSVLSESMDFTESGKKVGEGGPSGEKKLDDSTSTLDDGYSNLSDSLTTASTSNSYAFATNSQSKKLNLGTGIKAASRGGGASLSSLNKSIALDVSCLRLSASPNKSVDESNNLTLHIEGEAASNSVISDAISLRLTDSLSYSKPSTKSRVVDIEICNTPLSSLQFSICNIFEHSKHDSNNEVLSLKRALLVDNVRTLTVNNNLKLQYIDNSINSLSNLKYLDMSRNEIQTIAALINLPNLIGLNLSFNKLTSLDFLQLLISLQWLVVSNNNISNLKSSINLLVPLGKSLTTLDLSNNPVASQNNYVDEVFAILPNLKIFHSKNLATLRSFANSFNDEDEATIDSTSSNASYNNQWPNVNGKQDRNFEYRIKRALKRMTINEKRSVVQTGKINAVIASRNPTPVKSTKQNSPPSRTSGNEPSFRNSFDNSNLNDSAPVYIPESVERSNIPFKTFNPADVLTNNHSPSNVLQPKPASKPAYMQGTSGAATQRRKSQIGLLINHWGSHKNESKAPASANNVSMRASSPTNMSKSSLRSDASESKLLHSTGSIKNRRKSFGIGDEINEQLQSYDNSVSRSNNFVHLSSEYETSRGYYSEGENSSMKKSFRDKSINIDPQKFLEMQEDPRYSKWHSRYRVPKPTFGYSKPFKDRPDPTLTGQQWPRAKGFDHETKRVQEGFQKVRTGGTFTRASKGLPSDFYPMDHDDIEAIRRQGFFHDTIGCVSRFNSPTKKTKKLSLSQDDSHMSYSGSVLINGHSKGKIARRSSLGPHISRQYKSDSPTQHVEKDDPTARNHWITGSAIKKVSSFTDTSNSNNFSTILPSTPNITGQFSSSNINANNNNVKTENSGSSNTNNSSNNVHRPAASLSRFFNNSEFSENESNRSSSNSIDENRFSSDANGHRNVVDDDEEQENKLLNYMKWLDTAVLASKNSENENQHPSEVSSSEASSSPSLHDLASGSFR